MTRPPWQWSRIRRSARYRQLCVLLLIACVSGCTRTETATRTARPDDVAFSRLIEELSEPGGSFPSDNIVSNETSYLHVLGKMREIGVSGGVYVGVGPDQNFSYIAAIRPALAFIIDIRRDNLLQHLMYKALFVSARNRLEYLCMLLGRPIPADVARWDGSDLTEIIAYVDQTPRDPSTHEQVERLVHAQVEAFGVPLSESDHATIRRIRDSFYLRGLDIRYSRSSRHPTWRRLLLEEDLDGQRAGYLADEETFRYVQSMERQNRIIPVVGDVAGPHALAAIGQETRARGLTVSAFYISNVEQYLFRDGRFPRFAHTVSELPYDDRSVFVRSYFGRFSRIPPIPPGHYSAQLLERFDTFVDEYERGGYPDYVTLVRKSAIPLR